MRQSSVSIHFRSSMHVRSQGNYTVHNTWESSTSTRYITTTMGTTLVTATTASLSWALSVFQDASDALGAHELLHLHSNTLKWTLIIRIS